MFVLLWKNDLMSFTFTATKCMYVTRMTVDYMWISSLIVLLLSAGHQRGGAGAAGQHDDRDGRHRKQMWVETRQEQIKMTNSTSSESSSQLEISPFLQLSIHSCEVTHILKNALRRALCRATRGINTDWAKRFVFQTSFGTINANSHL